MFSDSKFLKAYMSIIKESPSFYRARENFEYAYASLFNDMLKKLKTEFLKQIIKTVEKRSNKQFLSDMYRRDKKFIENGVIHPCEFLDSYIDVVLENPDNWPDYKERIKEVWGELGNYEYENWSISRYDDDALGFITDAICDCDEDKVRELFNYLQELNVTIKGLQDWLQQQ